MGMIAALAFRNVLRNRRRTLLTATLIGFGLGTLILHDGLILGMREALILNSTRTFLGEAQIHAQGYRKGPELEKVISDWERVRGKLQAAPEVEAFAPRIIASGMLTSPRNISAVSIYGIDPALESAVSKVRQSIIQGEYLRGASETEILVGARLAELLEIGLGDRVVLTAAQAHGGELAQELFRVSGIMRFNSRQMDQGVVMLPLEKARKLVGLAGQVHEVAFRFRDSRDALREDLALWSELSNSGNEALGWRELMPQIKAVLEMMKYSTAMSAMILIGVISLGVVNSMFMSIHERMFEFGVLKAVGTRPRQIAMMILTEAAALALISIGIGLCLGAAVTYYFSTAGIDFAGMEYAGTTLSEPIRTVIEPMRQFVQFPVFVLGLTVVAGVYPAIHAARLIPTRAMRKSL